MTSTLREEMRAASKVAYEEWLRRYDPADLNSLFDLWQAAVTWATARQAEKWLKAADEDNPDEALLEAMCEAYTHYQRSCDRGYAQHEEGMRLALLAAIEHFRAAASVPEARQADGMVLVPVEPTEAMIEAACKLALDRIRRRVMNDEDGQGIVEGMREIYRAMITAAPPGE